MAKDAIIIAGAVCMVVGAWKLSPAVAWIIGGAFLFIGGVVFVAYDEQKKRGRK